MLAALTGMGLSAAAGLNAYIPILVVGLLANFTDSVTLPKEFSWLGNGWVLGIVAVLLAAEFVLDKVPVVDSVNDTIQTAIRPASGGIVFSATQAASDFDNSTWMSDHPWVGWLLGIVTALIVHVTKAAARPVINAGTAGVGAPVVSTIEDAGSIGLSFVAIFLPILVIVFLIALGFMAVWTYRKVRAFRRRRERRPVPD
ncbi:DUF4126 domain-containing protein [Actinokineospora xionganensis]|uniref:DUF4126 domain-containing protein n=1 Tax=Actinokineospora xionganensis TaxID=2684470 RepID=A0ABR7LE21_9PSEU|nr:DUF4126 domain-containing protein [Actinokineospora xionganensis]MBC6450959.1 DUF4126 domain-containing protein [Actinokineospora xionganensis]